jgi:uncharacterized membrane protein YfcA
MPLLLLVLATLITSFISGVLSMAGGIILMGVFSFALSVPAAMVLHGLAQTASNGSRIWIYRHHLRWGVFIPYSLGSFIILGFFVATSLVSNQGLVFLLIGTFPFLALMLPSTIALDIERKPVAFLSGLVVTLAQMLAGASGPVLDIFYNKSNLTRHEILGTKAITQTLGHVIKLGYYTFFLSLSTNLPTWIYPSVVVAAILGNWLGKHVIEKIDDAVFRQAGRIVILVLGIVYLGKGLVELDLLAL